MRGGNVKFPFGKGCLNIRSRRCETERLRQQAFQGIRFLRVNDLDGKRLIAIGTARKGDQD